MPDDTPLTIKTKQQTIAFLTNSVDDPNSVELWRGILDVARIRGGQVISFAGGSKGDPSGLESPRAVIYDLARSSRLDGIILWGAMINAYVTTEEIQAMAHRHAPLSIVSIGLELEGISNVVVDNYAGMWAAISHLIAAHHRQRIVFIGGPEGHTETSLRYRAYQDALAQNGLPLDPELVFSGDFQAGEAKTIVGQLLDERQIRFDAVAVNDDRVAGSLVDALQQRGVQVPEQVSVIGFDDQEMASCLPIPLTTVRIPNFEVGRQAAALLFDCLGGKPVGETQKVPLQLVIRQSCGCPRAVVQNARIRSQDLLHAAETFSAASLAVDLGGNGKDAIAGFSPSLVEKFFGCLEQDEPEEINSFMELLARVNELHGNHGNDLSHLDELISTLRRAALPRLVGQPERMIRAENALHQARVWAADAAERREVYRRIQTADRWELLNDIGQKLVATYDRYKLSELIYRRLPEMGIQGCYLSLYEDPEQPVGWARLVAAYFKEQWYDLPLEGVRFPAQEWVPDGYSLGDGSTNWMFLPINFNQEQIGFVLFEAGAGDPTVYETLRSQLGSALKGAALLNEVIALSLTDSLTGLANRRAFDLALTNEIEHSRRFHQDLALILIDLDNFKDYNDSFGHPAGDEALILISHHLEKAARRGLDIAARPGGDEFALLLVGTNLPDAIVIANDICRQAPQLPGLLQPITLSLGVAVADSRTWTEPGGLVEQADRMLYRAKQSGRNRVGRI